MAYWLVKSPFRSRTGARVVATGAFQLYGIRNAQARNAIAQMQPGDEALFYFQQLIWGTMKVSSEPVSDPTITEGRWLSISFIPLQTREPPIGLTILRTNPIFEQSALLRQPRLSVFALTADQWQEISTIGIGN